MELQQLKDVAKYLEYQHHHAIGADRLESELVKHCEDIGTTMEEAISGMEALIASKANNPVNTDSTNTNTNTNTELDPSVVSKLAAMSFNEAEGKAVKSARAEKQKEAMRLVRCTISCNNKNKSEFSGEIFCARNKILPEVKKFVPFGVPTHVPLILLNMIKEKQYQVFRTKKLPNGQTVKEPSLIPEYNIQELPPLTQQELDAIARKQLAEGYNGS